MYSKSMKTEYLHTLAVQVVMDHGQGVMEYVKRYKYVNACVLEKRVLTGCCCAVSDGQGVMEYERDTYVQVNVHENRVLTDCGYAGSVSKVE